MLSKDPPQPGEVVEKELKDIERIMADENAQDESPANAPARQVVMDEMLMGKNLVSAPTGWDTSRA